MDPGSRSGPHQGGPSSQRTLRCKSLILNGRGERIRTSDPLVPNQVLYQAEPLPELAVGRMFAVERSLAEPFVNARELHQSVSEGPVPEDWA
jgi:hypothetical protein